MISYPDGYVRGYLDARLPPDEACHDACERRLGELARAIYEQFPGVLLLPPAVEGRFATEAGYHFVRTRFRLWPGQGALLEGAVKPAAAALLREFDPQVADWMVSVHYRAESPGADAARRLPRPAVLVARERASRVRPPSDDRSG